MGFIVFEEEAFNYLDAQLENFVKRMDRIRERSEDKTMNKWLDTQDVCQTLNICPRTVQTLRDNGTLAYTQISHKTYYKPEDVMAIVAVVEDKKKDILTSSSCHPKALIKEFCYFLMSCHQHCLGIDLLVQR